MAQLSMFEKQKHYSKKDFTCSIGKFDVIYITFRNYSWRRFTTSEKIAVYIGASGDLRFDDPVCNKGVVLKMKKGNGHPDVVDSTRYIQLSGKKWTQILEVVRKTAGSYDFPKDVDAAPASVPAYQEVGTITPEDLRYISEEKKRLEELERSSKTQVRCMTKEDFATFKSRFYYDVSVHLEHAQSPEERVKIWDVIAALYGIKPAEETTPKRAPTDPTAGRTEGFEV